MPPSNPHKAPQKGPSAKEVIRIGIPVIPNLIFQGPGTAKIPSKLANAAINAERAILYAELLSFIYCLWGLSQSVHASKAYLEKDFLGLRIRILLII